MPVTKIPDDQWHNLLFGADDRRIHLFLNLHLQHPLVYPLFLLYHLRGDDNLRGAQVQVHRQNRCRLIYKYWEGILVYLPRYASFSEIQYPTFCY